MSRKSSVGRRKTFNVQTASPKEREKFFRLRDKAIREQEDKDFELNQKLYEERLKLEKIEKKDEERKAKFKSAISKLNPFRKKENKFEYKTAEGEPPLRTGGWDGKRGAVLPPSKIPRNVLYVAEKLKTWKDTNNQKAVRAQALKDAEDRIELDPEFRKYYYKHAQATLGGQPSKEMNDETKKFLNNSFKNFPKTREDRIKYAVAEFMTNSSAYYNNMIESDTKASRKKWIRRYGEI